MQVIETRKTKLGLNYLDTLISIANLAFTWKGLGQDAEAMQLTKDCVQRRTRTLGAKHPGSLSSRLTLDE